MLKHCAVKYGAVKYVVARFSAGLVAAMALWALPVSAAETQRVISAGPGVTELIVALDKADELVAVDSSSNLPQDSKAKKLGYHRALSAEGILAESPSVLIGTPVTGPKSAVELVESAGVKVVILPDARDGDTLLSNVDTLADVLDAGSRGQALKTSLAASLNELANAREALKDQQISMLFLLVQPGRATRVGGNDTAVNIVMKLAGGVNAAGFGGYQTLSEEGILALNPDMILVSLRDPRQAQNPKAAVLEALPLLEHLPAIAQDRVFHIPGTALMGGLGISAITVAQELTQSMGQMR
ncbi:MAG: ABC transporter substrate-binding protein [Shewanella sp.]|nr:ABC transporter substrate-binding protein [Shewanella sp.]MCF1431280.1 ABC transporter substrate-binding protein [Shewanella sp.]MCF1438604.1 ABC transporter substrate-binding protein [Shewanella sp.]MCF1457890.1 ABC transporter substrate-binding protein [Shewanella sp.]